MTILKQTDSFLAKRKQMASYFDPALTVLPELIQHLPAFLQQLSRH